MSRHRTILAATVVGLVVSLLPATSRANPDSYNEFSPPVRVGAIGGYDPVRDRYLVVGGANGYYGLGGQVRQGAWTLDPGLTTAWQPLATGGDVTPGAGFALLLHDPVRDRMLFYGYGAEIWALTLGANPTWSVLARVADGPAGRINMSCIYDPVGDRLVFFGGSGPHPTLGNVLWNETWDLTLSGVPAWHKLDPGGTLPPIMTGAPAVYDSSTHSMVVYQAGTVYALALGASPDWGMWPGTTAPNFSGPLMVDDAAHNRIVFEGANPAHANAVETWALPLGGGGWQQLPGAAGVPLAYSAIIWDPVRSRLVSFGGAATPQLANTGGVDETWINDLNDAIGWRKLGPPLGGEEARSRATLFRDPARPRLLAFAGYDANAPGYGTTAVQYDLATGQGWSPLSVPAAIADLPGHLLRMAFDPRRRQLMAPDPSDFTQLEIYDAASDTWSTRATTNGVTSDFFAYSAVVDSIGDRLIVLGTGTDPTYHVSVVEAWALSLATPTPTWVQLQPAGGPRPATTGNLPAVALYDALRNRVLVFGDGNVVWELSLAGAGTWTQLANLPTSIYSPSLGYDQADDRLYIFYADYNRTGQTWFYLWPLSSPPSAAGLLAPGGSTPNPGTGWSGTWDAPGNRFLLLGGPQGFWSYDPPPPPPRPTVSISCPSPRTTAPGAAIDLAFYLSQNSSQGHTYHWRIDSARAWPGYPLTGTVGLSDPSPYDVTVLRVPVPDSAAAGPNVLTFGVVDVNDASVRDSCTTNVQTAAVASASLECPAPGTWVAGAVVPMVFQITQPSSLAHDYGWTLISQRAWPGFPLTGSQAVSARGSVAVNVGVPVPDSAAVGTNHFGFALFDLADPSQRDSCATALASGSTTTAPRPLAFAGSGAFVVHGAIEVSFWVPGPGPARVDAFDLRGRPIASAAIDAAGPGSYALQLASAGALRPGMYFLRLTQGAVQIQGRALVLPGP